MNANYVYEEHVLEVLENSGTLDNGKPWSNYTIVTCLHRDGKPYKIEYYKGSPNKLATVFNISTIEDLRKLIIGRKVISYSFDKFGKVNSFICSAMDD